MRSVGILSLGCKVNTYESEYIIQELKRNHYEVKDFTDFCDVYIINTCTVTNASDSKSRKMIRSAIRRNPDACIVVMGCFVAAKKKLDIEGVDITLGNQNKSKIVSLLDEWFATKQKVEKVDEVPLRTFENMYIDAFPSRTRAFVKIQDGCENFCSYCIIPFVRGKCRSKEKDVVLKEIHSLVQHGYLEIVLTGIHTGNYGVDLHTNFASLLKEIVKIPGLFRLRISSIEITELTDEVLDVIKENKVIVDHLHIPLQAGSDSVLKAMMRKYDLKEYEEILKKIRRIRKDISITTDVIVGFPGETEEDFEETLAVCKKFQFSKIHVFPYSKREKTKAANMPNQVSSDVKKTRAKRLIALSQELETEYMKKQIGKKVEVLIEKEGDKESIGHTSNYLLVKLMRKEPQNHVATAVIKKVEYPYCIAE